MRAASRLCVTALVLAACGPLPAPPSVPTAATALGVPAPSRAIQLRAAFDKDPSVYIGRFIPDSAQPGDLDENNAAQTRCSKFIKPKTVEAQQQMDETMYLSRSASASLGVPMIATADGSRDSTGRVRVKYSLARKMQSEVDADGLAQCCQADASQCTTRYIGEFLLGTGDVLQSAKDTTRGMSDLKVPNPLSANADFKAEGDWNKKTSFKEVYFAFLPTLRQTAPAPAVSDCSWCDALPGSLDGKYFCGVSPTSRDEASARSLAMRAAREQVVQYLGQSLSVKSTTTSSALSSLLDDHEVVKAAAEGIAAQVKDQKWCPAERVPTPEGEKYRTKVLAFYPKTAEDEGRRAVADAAADAGKKSGKLSAEDQKSVRDAGKKGR